MNQLQAAGASDDKQSKWAPIYTNRFFLGLWTNRNPLRAPTGVIYENYYRLGGTDALIGGTNVELSNRLTVCRRPGNPAGLSTFISSSNIPDIPDSFYSFHEIAGTVRVFADTPTAPYIIGGAVSGSGTGSQGVIPIFTKAAGITQSFFQGINQSLYFSDSAEQQKWLDFGAGNPGNSFSTITAVSLTSNVATITAVNNFSVGQTVVISQTTTSSGLFNVTATITAANSAQFSFNLTHANVGSTADTGFANATWIWQPTAPTVAPKLNIVASGSAAISWVANTVFSTMGFIVDANGNVQQMISVNASGTNTTQLGTTSNGEPAWNQTPGGTTADGTITWTNWGPIGTWTANTVYNNAAIGGTAANPSQIYDPTTLTGQINAAPGNSQGTSGGTKPAFKAIQGSNLHDPATSNSPPAVKWYAEFPAWQRWQGSHAYPAFQTGGTNQRDGAIIEPFNLPAPNNQTVYLQISNGGTSGASGTAPAFATTTGSQTSDGDLIWLCLGSATWAANTPYTQWTGTQPIFSALKDQNGNMQVCTVSGKSGSTVPLQQWQATHVYVNGNTIVDQNGNLQTVTSGGTSGVSKTLSTSVISAGIATYTTTTNHGYAVGQFVTITGSTHNAAFNVVNALILSIPALNQFTISNPHDDIGAGADAGNADAGPTWNTSPAGTTTDGGVTWTNGSVGNGWGTNYGDLTKDGTATWVCVGPSMSWVASTKWYLPAVGFAPPTPSQPYGGAEIIVSTSVQAVIVSGKSSGSIPSFSTTVGNYSLDNAATWRDIAVASQNSISWTKGYGYIYAFEARTTSDPYNTAAPPGVAAPLGTPTGSADGSVSTASPSVQMAVGANAGSVVYVTGLGSTDPQVDTISIYRTFDGGATFFLLTKIKNPAPQGGIAQPWSFQDFLPDVATASFPGLNTLVLGPINHSNDAPLAGAINLVQYFGRIFYSVGATVYCSQGPNVGGSNQPPGNGYTAFNPGQFWTFTSPVTRLVPTTVGLLVFTSSDLGIISGGPSITTLFNNIYVPGLGLTSYNALTVRGGLIDLFTADNQVVTLDPNMGVSKIGYPVGDQFIKYGAQTTTFNPSSSYVTFHTQGLNDEALFIADGSTGWFRCVPSLAPDASISGPVWSPKATIVNGVKAIQSLEVAPGQHALLLGGTSANKPVLVRDSTYTTFSDNGSAYPSYFIFGSIILANPGQFAEVGFVTCEFQKVGTSPILSVMMDEIADSVMVITAASQSGSNTTYTFTLTSGFNPVIGSGITITGMADSGNNGTFIVNATGANTFTVTNASGVTRAAQTGAGTLFESLAGYIASATGLPPQDPPLRYGLTLQAASTYANRYYFAQNINGIVPPQGTFCRHMQMKIDFGSSDTTQNELLTMTIFGRHWQEI